ncbi:hypothetical protein GBA52_020130 [Prunus armeniaca]|nr:hypothetical protein GBA52_020130 [Prunus armeniaca]
MKAKAAWHRSSEVRTAHGNEPEQSAKKSSHAPKVVLGLNSPNAESTLSTRSHRHPQQDLIPHVPVLASFSGENDFDPLEV